jgi:hypothetical protein
MVIVDHYLYFGLDAGRRAVAVLRRECNPRENGPRANVAGMKCWSSDRPRRTGFRPSRIQGRRERRIPALIGLAQEERILPVQLIELGAQRNGAVHRVAVLRARTSVDGDRSVLVAGQDTYGHV